MYCVVQAVRHETIPGSDGVSHQCGTLTLLPLDALQTRKGTPEMLNRTIRRSAIAVTALALGAASLLAGGAAFAADVEDPADTTTLGPGNFDPTQTGSITVHKHEGIAANSDSAEADSTEDTLESDKVVGVEFSLYKVDDIDLNDWQTWQNLAEYKVAQTGGAYSVIREAPADADAAGEDAAGEDAAAEEFTTTIVGDAQVTDADGVVTFSDLEVGVYVVAETDASGGYIDANGNGVKDEGEAAVAVPSEPFIVTVPYPTTGEESQWLYDVNVYPKNGVSAVRKNFWNPIETQTVGSDAGVPVENPAFSSGQERGLRWQVAVDLPKTPITSLQVRDQIADSIDPATVKLLDENTFTGATGGNWIWPIALDNPDAVGQNFFSQFKDDWYTAAVTDDGYFEVTFTGGSLNYLNRLIGADDFTHTLYLNFQANAKADQLLGIENDGVFNNTAEVVFNANPDAGTAGTTVTSNEATITFGQAFVEKVDSANGEALAGAKFKLYNAQNPYADTCEPTPTSVVDANNAIAVNGETELVSDAEGMIEIPSLFISTNSPVQSDGLENTNRDAQARCYVLEEVEAPAGYTLPTDGSQFTAVKVLAGQEQTADTAFKIENTKSTVPELPLTGANGQIILMAVGAALLAISLGLVVVRRRRESVK